MPTLSQIEVVPPGSTHDLSRQTIVVGDDGAKFSHDWWLTDFGRVSDAGIIMSRIGIGAFLADRAVRRNELRQRRQINLVVPVPAVRTAAAAREAIQRLLSFITGDEWTLQFVADRSRRQKASGAQESFHEVALLSGGLDSFCGALIGGTNGRLFLSHSDAPVIRSSQTKTIAMIPGLSPDQLRYVRLAAAKPFAKEPSRRSRSLLFISLAVALADAVGAANVEVPENGFTSLNPPLAANRGGVLTTRSTHPLTFHLAAEVLAQLGVPVTLRNPYEWETKGQLVANAVGAAGATVVQAGLSQTLSCAKSNMILPGKTPGRNCGLDYACIVRRAGVLAAGIADTTQYECNTPGMEEQVLKYRSQDVAAVKIARLRPPGSVADLAAISGPFPPGYNYGKGHQLWKDGHAELCALPLP